MAKKPFDISAFAASLQPIVSDSDIPVEQITYIDIDLLDGNDHNFYALTGIEDLASNIQLCGLQQPVRVRPSEAGRYRIVSGHRRRAAMQSLVDQGMETYRKISCIVEIGECSEAMQELRLIFANSSTRQLTSAEQMHQVERVEALLYQLKEEGVDFPGRMRDQVAAACKVTGTKLAELKVIREKLQEPFKGQFNRDEITVSAAYKLARLPKHIQSDVAKAVGDRYRINYVGAENLSKYAANYYSWASERVCEKTGEPCCNVSGMLKRTAKTQYAWQYCSGRCCLTCSDRYGCAGACKYAKQRNAEEKAAESKRQASAEKRRECEAAECRKSNIRYAQRLLRAIERAGLDDDECLLLSTCACDRKVKTVKSIAAGDTGKIRFFTSNIFLPPSDGLAALADQLHCSTDYILGRTEDLTPQPTLVPAPAAPADPWQPLERDHWPNQGELVLLAGGTPLDGRCYLAARCVGSADDAFPFDDAHDGLSVDDMDDFSEWISLCKEDDCAKQEVSAVQAIGKSQIIQALDVDRH